MAITHQQELQPFQVPNYVLTVAKVRPRQDGVVETPKYALHELSDEVLEALCAQFREDVMAKVKADRAS